jgi:hypothetical protein
MLIPGQRQVQTAFEICGLLDHLPFRHVHAVGFDRSERDSPGGISP